MTNVEYEFLLNQLVNSVNLYLFDKIISKPRFALSLWQEHFL